MNRARSYDVPHKGLRNALSQLLLLAGKTNYHDVKEVENLFNLGNRVFTILNVHAQDENQVTLAELEVRCPGSSTHDVEDHEQIHVIQQRLEKLLLRIYERARMGGDHTEDEAEFYLSLSEFIGKYLEHTAEEERVTQLLLWKYFTDEELGAQRSKIMGRLSPDTLLIWFSFILPAQCHAERVGLLSGFKKMAPEAFFSQAMDVIEKNLNSQEFALLKKALG
jgi:hypothetical protein